MCTTCVTYDCLGLSRFVSIWRPRRKSIRPAEKRLLRNTTQSSAQCCSTGSRFRSGLGLGSGHGPGFESPDLDLERPRAPGRQAQSATVVVLLRLVPPRHHDHDFLVFGGCAGRRLPVQGLSREGSLSLGFLWRSLEGVLSSSRGPPVSLGPAGDCPCRD